MLFTSSERHSDPKRFGAERQKLFLSVQSLELIEPVILVDSASSTICIHFFFFLLLERMNTCKLRRFVLPKYGFEGGPKAQSQFFFSTISGHLRFPLQGVFEMMQQFDRPEFAADITFLQQEPGRCLEMF